MPYDVRLKRSAEKELIALPDKIHDRIIATMVSLKTTPLPVAAIKLQGRDGYRIRVGQYRVLYTIDNQKGIIEIFSVSHRKEAYRF